MQLWSLALWPENGIHGKMLVGTGPSCSGDLVYLPEHDVIQTELHIPHFIQHQILWKALIDLWSLQVWAIQSVQANSNCLNNWQVGKETDEIKVASSLACTSSCIFGQFCSQVCCPACEQLIRQDFQAQGWQEMVFIKWKNSKHTLSIVDCLHVCERKVWASRKLWTAIVPVASSFLRKVLEKKDYSDWLSQPRDNAQSSWQKQLYESELEDVQGK